MGTYYIGGIPITDELYHYGVPGQSWGRRRFQNADGSLTALGRDHYGVGDPINPATVVTPKPAATQTPVTYATKARSTPNYASTVARSPSVSSYSSRISQNPVNQVQNQNTGTTASSVNQNVQNLISSFSDMDKISSWLNETDDVLKRGAKSKKDVESLQRALSLMGYSLNNFGVDGKFGAETEGALNKFKRDMGLKEDGILDFETSRKLQGAIEDHINAERRKQITVPVQNALNRNVNTVQSAPQPQVQSQTQIQAQPADQNTNENQAATNIEGNNSVVDDLVNQTLERSRSSGGSGVGRQAIATSHERGKTMVEDLLSRSMTESARKGSTESPNTLKNKLERNLKRAVKKAPKTAKKTMKAVKRDIKVAKRTSKKIAKEAKNAYRGAKKSIKQTSKARRKMYSDISKTLNNVSASAASVSNKAKSAIDSITKSHNKLVKDVGNAAKSVERYFNTKTKKKKSSYANSSFVESGKRLISNILG